VAAMLLGLLSLSGIAIAAQSPDPVPSFQDCQPDPAHYGEFPSCTYDDNGKIIDKTYNDGPFGTGDGGGGIPGWFAALFVLAIVGGIGVTVWRVSMARAMATRAGLDPHDATAVTLMSDDGLGATYLAASLAGKRQHQQPQQPADASDRLRELEQLRDQKLITDAEYDARRKAIVESI